ncbi:L,D-transpeptidase family protein [Spirillospora sp. NPDC047279]|uniref:L,D-transpeptidase family protein n=1 Tax=Spirillospora sp. NPDC047279 TaxID=3155478 RepID=UPI0034014053
MIAGTALAAASLLLPAAAPLAAAPPALAPPAARIAGATGPDIRDLQKRLKELHYDPGPVTGTFDERTRVAVWAFQKANRIQPSGAINARTRGALEHPRAPRALVTGKAARNRVEISKRRQLLVVYRKGRIALITHVSTGSGRSYCGPNGCGVARTPSGDFTVFRRLGGWHRSALGYMYRPLYFHGGYAIHGSLRVPRRPASHGCVRVPMHTADLLPRLVRNGTRVHVR